MIDGLPQTFRKSPEVSANYDFSEILSGTGYIRLYAGTGELTDPTILYTLTDYTFYPQDKYVQGSTNSLSYTKVLDLDFDVTLNRSLTIQGNAIINVTFGVGELGGAGDSYGYVVGRIRKYSGSTETEIGSAATSKTVNSSGGSTGTGTTFIISVPQTNYREGDKLRLTIEGWLKTTAIDSSAQITIYTDPMNRSASLGLVNADYTYLTFQVPIKIDL